MICDICQEVCLNNNDFMAHQKMKHKIDSGARFVCEICGMKELTLNGYLTHMRGSHQLSKKELYDKFHKGEQEGHCSVCGVDTVWAPHCNKWGYHDMCKEHDRERRNSRRRKTTLAKYGVNNVAQLDRVREKMHDTYKAKTGYDHPRHNPSVVEQAKKTCQARYGYDHAGQVPSIKTKIRKTFESYEGGHPLRDPAVRMKIQETCLDRYGVANPMQSSQIKEKALGQARVTFHEQINTRLAIYGLRLVELSKGPHKGERVTLHCTVCDHIFEHYVHNGLTPLCPLCYPTGRSKEEQEIYKFFAETGNKVLLGSRKILPGGLELDFYLPEHNFALEYNGLWWHSTHWNKNPNYHLNKTLACKDLGITLFHLFGDEWSHKKDLVKAMLRNRVGQADNRVHGRTTTVIKPNNLDDFYEHNHLQGRPFGKQYHYALIYKEHTICALTICPSYISGKGHLEIARFAVKMNHIVHGGFAKLLKQVEADFSGNQLVTYADNRYSEGALYRNNGFTCEGLSKPGFFYTRGNKRYNRLQFQKHKLSKKLENFDPGLTAEDNLRRHGFYRIYDCGQWRFSKLLTA